MDTINNEDFLQNTPQKEASTIGYPDFPIHMMTSLRAIQKVAKADPQYLRSSACPYPVQIRTFLTEILVSGITNPEMIELEVDEFFGEGNDERTYDILVRDAKRNYVTLTNLGRKMENSPKPEEQLARIKTLTQAQERLLAVIEKAEGLNQIQNFKRVVMDVIDRALSPDQRTQIMLEIEAALKS